MMNPIRHSMVLAALLLTFAGATTRASAGLIPSLDSVNPILGGYLYQYHVDLSDGSYVESAPVASFLSLYDIPGYLKDSASFIGSSDGGTITQQLLGPDVTGIFIPDDAQMWNIAFTYTGTQPIAGPHPNLFAFQFISEFDVARDALFYGGATAGISVTGGPQGTQYFGGADYTVAGPAPGTNVPEPSSLALLLSSGVAGTLLAFRRRA